MKYGIIGGTGLYHLEGLESQQKVSVETPFGAPSSELLTGKLKGKEVVFLPRHGENHQILPSEINFRANLWALKSLGVRQILSVSATGSLREELAPGELAIANQYFDWTRGIRRGTFFGEGLVGHISTAEPSCADLSQKIMRAAEKVGVKVHKDKTYATVEGPRLGTRAESFFLRGAGADMVGMTNLPEAFLAREAQMGYLTIAIITDYDCWKDDPEEHVTVEKVMARYQATLGNVLKLLNEFFESEANAVCDRKETGNCLCRDHLKTALVTPPDRRTSDQAKLVEVLSR